MGRTILVALLAMAIAMLPASMSFAGAASTASAVTSAAQSMPDCDHYRHHDKAPSKQTQKTADHGACVVNCALCFGFVGPAFTGIAYAVAVSASLTPLRASTDISSLMGSPPFRPPRA